MASRFWAAASSSEEESSEKSESSEWGSEGSESESDDSSKSSSESSSSGSSSENARNKFLAGGDSDWDSDDSDARGGKRTVRSGRDKILSAISDVADAIDDAVDAGEWTVVLDKVDDLFQAADKWVTLTSGPTRKGRVPNAFVRALVELEDGVEKQFAEENKEELKKLNKTNAKALNTLRQRLRKAVQVDDLPELMKRCRADPGDFLEEDEEADEGGAEADRAAEPEKDSIFSMDPKDITFKVVNEKLQEARLQRGRKGVSRQDQLNLLLFLRRHAKGQAQEVAVVLALISLMFDLLPATATHLPAALWRRSVLYLSHVLDVVETSGSVVVDELAVSFDEATDEPDAAAGPVRVPGNLVGLVERLDEELFKCLQHTDPHTNEYLSRLKDEAVLLAVAQRVSKYLESRGDTAGVARVALRRIEHYYFKTDAVFEALRRTAQEPIAITMKDAETRLSFAMEREGAEMPVEDDGAEEAEAPPVEEAVARMTLRLDISRDETLTDVVKSLAQVIYRHGDERSKTRALLCSVYHLSLRGAFYQARDTLLMSHLQESVTNMDIQTQILFNRAMAMFGICKFKAGLIQESYNCMAELYGSGHAKELLAQGLIQSKTPEKTQEQEALERRRQMPFHMHINLELMETVHLSCCLVLDLPQLVRGGRAAMQSLPFKRLMDNQAKASFIGPPETVRDHIMAGARALLQGDWELAMSYVSALKAWDLLPQKANAMEMLREQLKKTALKVYLLKFADAYSSISVPQLTMMFQLPREEVLTIASQMAYYNDLAGSLDQPSQTIVISRVRPSELHAQAQGVIERARHIVEMNERALQVRLGGLQDQDEEGRPIDRAGDERGARRSRMRGGFSHQRMRQFVQGERMPRSEFALRGRGRGRGSRGRGMVRLEGLGRFRVGGPGRGAQGAAAAARD